MEANLINDDARRTSTLALATAVALIILTAIAIGAFTGVIPYGFNEEDATQGRPVLAVELASAIPGAVTCSNCGTVASIRTVELRQAAAQDAGDDSLNTAETILRSAGGLFSGQEFEKSPRKRYTYRVTLRMEDGSYRTVSEATPPRFAIGEKVRLVNGTLAASS